MTAYITKYALSQGIFEAEVAPSNTAGYMVDKRPRYQQVFGPTEWHPTMEDAVKQAEQLRLRKIASLKKQVDKLEKLTF